MLLLLLLQEIDLLINHLTANQSPTPTPHNGAPQHTGHLHTTDHRTQRTPRPHTRWRLEEAEQFPTETWTSECVCCCVLCVGHGVTVTSPWSGDEDCSLETEARCTARVLYTCTVAYTPPRVQQPATPPGAGHPVLSVAPILPLLPLDIVLNQC